MFTEVIDWMEFAMGPCGAVKWKIRCFEAARIRHEQAMSDRRGRKQRPVQQVPKNYSRSEFRAKQRVLRKAQSR